MRLIKIISLLLISGLLITACASSRSGKVYSRDEARKSQSVQTGVIVRVDSVTIEGTKSPVGAVAGGALGGAAGSAIGRGTGQLLGAVAGAVAGGLAGAAAEEGITRKDGLEITVRLDSGRDIVVVQEADEQFSPGQRVRIVTAPDGTTRVRPN